MKLMEISSKNYMHHIHSSWRNNFSVIRCNIFYCPTKYAIRYNGSRFLSLKAEEWLKFANNLLQVIQWGFDYIFICPTLKISLQIMFIKQPSTKLPFLRIWLKWSWTRAGHVLFKTVSAFNCGTCTYIWRCCYISHFFVFLELVTRQSIFG